ncbi:MAG TPA: ATP-binding protein [Polyangiaceae bacterium]|nr:ATP-binding protein [Polyangiaceae bacterium]
MDAWGDDSRRVLALELSSLKQLCHERSGATSGAEATTIETSASLRAERDRTAARMDRQPPLDFLRDAFALDDFESRVLVLACAAQLDAGFLPLFSALGAEKSRLPTPALALELFASTPAERATALAAFLPTSPLRRHRLVEFGEHPSQVLRPLSVDERLLAFVQALPTEDARLEPLLEPLAPALLTDAERVLAVELTALFTTVRKTARPVVNLVGGPAQRRIARAALEALNASIAELVVSRLLPDELDGTLRLLAREATLTRRAYYVDATGRDVRAVCERLDTIVIVGSEEPLPLTRPVVVLSCPRLTAPERVDLWRRTLGEHASKLNGTVEGVAQQFELEADAIAQLGATLVARAAAHGGEIGAAELWRSCRERAARAVDGRATRIEPARGFDDLVLPSESLEQLRAIEGQVRARGRVLDEWGFGAKLVRGRGTAVLFAGPSGTGKTLAAEVLAHELGLDLLRVELAGVVDKYIGETEKNLRRVFEAAQASGAVLFFDEADALFAARTDVKSSHDRYANAEVNYLLQLMEDYRGVAILATNRRAALDRAFLRRLRFVVDFPHPDATLRRGIWERVFPQNMPRDGLELDALARLDVTGGSIRTIALNAALAAAHAGEPVRMSHVMTAARREYAKLDKLVTPAEFGVHRGSNR